MAIDVDTLWIYRIMSIDNLKQILQNGTFCKRTFPADQEYPTIGNTQIIDQRSTMPVKCYPGTVVNDYVPFYFSVRTPMLYNIITGMGVPKRPQKEIIYLCYKLHDLATADFQWCYTDGNAAKKSTKFYTDLGMIETSIDWRSINTTDFANNNADGDEDRIRKKHAEFLVRGHVPAVKISAIVVYNADVQQQVTQIIKPLGYTIPIHLNNKFYF